MNLETNESGTWNLEPFNLQSASAKSNGGRSQQLNLKIKRVSHHDIAA
jgi:hypothetical protein